MSADRSQPAIDLRGRLPGTAAPTAGPFSKNARFAINCQLDALGSQLKSHGVASFDTQLPTNDERYRYLTFRRNLGLTPYIHVRSIQYVGASADASTALRGPAGFGLRSRRRSEDTRPKTAASKSSARSYRATSLAKARPLGTTTMVSGPRHPALAALRDDHAMAFVLLEKVQTIDDPSIKTATDVLGDFLHDVATVLEPLKFRTRRYREDGFFAFFAVIPELHDVRYTLVVQRPCPVRETDRTTQPSRSGFRTCRSMARSKV